MISKVVTGEAEGDHSIIVTSARHHAVLQNALSELILAREAVGRRLEPELIAFDVRSVMDTLGELTGVVRSEDILDEIFSNFCIGK
jgi:tRNA modification GTPase